MPHLLERINNQTKGYNHSINFVNITFIVSNIIKRRLVFKCLFFVSDSKQEAKRCINKAFSYTNKQFYFKQLSLARVHSLIVKNISISSYSV